MEELDEFLKGYFRRKKLEVRTGIHNKLIRAIFRAAFNEHKTEASVKEALKRITKKESSQPASQEQKTS